MTDSVPANWQNEPTDWEQTGKLPRTTRSSTNRINTLGSLNITAASMDPALLDLPWHIPLEEWPKENLAALPRGISRHVVRFARLGDSLIAIKETSEHVARQEYHMLRKLRRLNVPAVAPVAVITGRMDPAGEELQPVLVTRHLRFSLPYRAVFSQTLREVTLTRLIDAQALLLVRLHLAGFYWGDVSLSNTLFRRDAGAFAAYLVDAETGELYPELSNGQREYDLEIARVNIAGELMDLAEGGLVEESVDPLATSERIMDSYRRLWAELTERESFGMADRWRVDARIRRLNDLGFDVDELSISTTPDGTQVQLQPKVVDAGHHQRRLLRLTGIDAQENQARRLLNDLDSYRVTNHPELDEELSAHLWVTQVFEPIVKAVPRDLGSKLEAAEVVHEVLEHRWYMSENANRNVPMAEAVQSYMDTILRHRRDEAAILLSTDTRTMEILDAGGAPA
ncbi:MULTISPECIES: DUF4032 domain-containing protein [unclassified Arthrobacter]|uniref:DUF4032 domain-containing protein n=1 Tax=unclassified Arthrobacter TaxID=235627 RepID=UPI001D136F0F|nr:MULTISPECIES: DUF4032 domain-containing protein [unclassified Arthrobacter]MCC3301966.1 DUF4032 domain-containing protein [Arthrobacter sp. zg-Y895]MCQ1947395.1 DUF4032 domain-containing protein [Arthrobacter sp. zg-Y1116]MCQ1987348.1 DUF4032 domain-containing protein [Arthrobacter sp. zg-Y844]MCQ1996692.1 DUF4032 domain-containing protein [Arthrobacter sp. zg-Y1171]UWX82290.1 DUF4032 domain-containing protein [Arthrobacter sp. zg-Y1171]